MFFSYPADGDIPCLLAQATSTSINQSNRLHIAQKENTVNVQIIRLQKGDEMTCKSGSGESLTLHVKDGKRSNFNVKPTVTQGTRVGRNPDHSSLLH